MSIPSTIFICGATGTQGGAITDHLLKHNNDNIQIKTITRSITSPSAKALKSKGVSITEGDFDDAILQQTLAGCTGLFLNLMPEFTNPSLEFERAQRILSLAIAAGVTNVVYSSAFAVNDPSKLRHWDPTSLVAKVFSNKQAIENEVRAADFPSWTILRPGNFMSNFLLPMAHMYQGLVDQGVWSTALTPQTVIPMVDPNDIGQFGAAALLDPARFHGKEVEIASELLLVEEVLGLLSQASGRQLKAAFLLQEEIDAQLPRNRF